MQYTMLKAKFHKARVTNAELEYDGSCAIDGALLDRAGIREYEQIHIYNITNGERLVTYTIRAQDGSGTISMNGAAAHKANTGDRVIICAYAVLSERELTSFKPTFLYLDEHNRIIRSRDAIPVQVA